jgi:hypothetical protein
MFELDEHQSEGEEKLRKLIAKDEKYFDEKEKKQFITDLFY